MNTYGRYPIAISHGKGTKLYDLNEKEYIDFAAGIATCCLGYANPVLKKAVSEQMDRVHHCSNLYFIPEQAELAKWIVKNSCADKVRYVKSHTGTIINEKAELSYWCISHAAVLTEPTSHASGLLTDWVLSAAYIYLSTNEWMNEWVGVLL